MGVNKNSVAYMRTYLKYAIEFEKYVYVWANAMESSNDRMREIFDERKILESAIAHSNYRAESYNYSNEQQRKQKETQKFKRNSICIPLIVIGIFFVLSFAAVIVLDVSAELAVLPINMMWPIVLGIFIFYRIKASKTQQEATRLAQRSYEMQPQTMWNINPVDAENELMSNYMAETVVNQQQEEIHKALIEAKKNLQLIYAENVLPVQYRSLSAVVTLYEYLETGRCNKIQGHGGIYDTYEVEKMQIRQLQQMVQMNQRLGRIEDSQRYICREMYRANQTLSSINSSLGEIEKTNAQIAKNTAVSAAANQQTAAATQWLAWRAWANGR